LLGTTTSYNHFVLPAIIS